MSPNLPELLVQKCIESKADTNEYNNNSPTLVDRNIQRIDEKSVITKKDPDVLVYKKKVNLALQIYDRITFII